MYALGCLHTDVGACVLTTMLQDSPRVIPVWLAVAPKEIALMRKAFYAASPAGCLDQPTFVKVLSCAHAWWGMATTV